MLAITLIVNRFLKLEYLTFSRQPVTEGERLKALLPFQVDGKAEEEDEKQGVSTSARRDGRPAAVPAAARAAAPDQGSSPP